MGFEREKLPDVICVKIWLSDVCSEFRSVALYATPVPPQGDTQVEPVHGLEQPTLKLKKFLPKSQPDAQRKPTV